MTPSQQDEGLLKQNGGFLGENGLPQDADSGSNSKIKATLFEQCQTPEDPAGIATNCDLGQPECDRCIRLGKRCPGYRDESSLLFRNEDLSSIGEQSASRERRRSSQLRGQSISDPSGTSTPQLRPEPLAESDQSQTTAPYAYSLQMELVLSKEGWHSPPPRDRPDDWEEYTLPLVLNLFTHHNKPFCLCRALPVMLVGSSDDSSLVLSCKALGFAVLANKVSSVPAQAARDDAYGKALTATNAAVGDPELCKQDVVLISVWLLSIYEVVTASNGSSPPSGPLKRSVHTQGLIELLRIRGSEQLKIEHSRNIFWLLTSAIQIRSLIGGKDCPSYIEEWVDAYEAECPPAELDRFRVVKFSARSVKVCSIIRQTLDSNMLSRMPWTIQQLWAVVQELQSVLEDVLSYGTQSEAVAALKLHVQNQYRTCHTRTLQFVCELLESDLPAQDFSIDTETINHIHAEATTSIQALATATSDSAATILGPNPSSSDTTTSLVPDWFDVLRILWPLRMLGGHKHNLTASQVEQVDAMLQRINDDFHIRQAVAPYNNVVLADNPTR